MEWYILQSLSGQEQRIATLIKEKAAKDGLDKYIEEVIVPTEKVSEIHKGKKITTNKKFLPGYVLLKMDMQDSLWHLITSIPKVGKFLGAGGKPTRVSEAEIAKIMKQLEESVIAREKEALFVVGDFVQVKEGPFESFKGTIEDIDMEKQKLKVELSIFGRPTPIELTFDQVSKVNSE
ncbi:MAG: transcription termination/antitermination factor NusG [Rickettsiales bacterium]|nr:transcription termination/antitermination factor NusG [Rickettsiales bacterium]